MNLSQRCAAILLSAALSAACTMGVGAEKDLKSAGRDVFAKNKGAVVSVKLVVTTRTVESGKQTDKSDAKYEVAGTVVDPSGLTVISESILDPEDDTQVFIIGGGGEEAEGEKIDTKPDHTVSDVKIILGDGTEVPAEVVLKDKDLDLAFIKPKQKLAEPLPFIKFEKTADPELLDDTITIKRLGAELNRTNSISFSHIQAVIKKPRTFYVCDASEVGCPVFNSNGVAVGVQLVRKNPVKAGANESFDFEFNEVVLSAEDLAEAARQALAAKKE